MKVLAALLASLLLWLANLVGGYATSRDDDRDPETVQAEARSAVLDDSAQLAEEHQAAFREATQGWTIPLRADEFDDDKEAEEAARYAR